MNSVSFNFIVPKHPDYSLLQMKNEAATELYKRGEFIWGLQSYMILKRYGLSATLSHDLDRDSINLAHGNVLRKLEKRWDCFCVSLQADFPHYSLAHYHIVQNQEQVTRNTSYIMHWTQPRQISRDGSRSDVRKVAYQGDRKFTDLDEARLQRDLQSEGIEFEILDAPQWPFLQDVDVLLGIRAFGNKAYKRKPPTKLVDAWLAGIPFIGGWDSAYVQTGVPGKDYLRVSSYDELLNCIRQLKHDPVLYNTLVEAGKKRVVHYTEEAIAGQWKQLLEKEIAQAYQVWRLRTAKQFKYRLKICKYTVHEIIRENLQKLYRFPKIKHYRDQYYDPTK